MEALELLEPAAGAAALILAVSAVAAFRRKTSGILLAATILCLVAYNALPFHAEDGVASWFRHMPVYAGLIALLFFLRSLPQPVQTTDRPRPSVSAAVVAGGSGTLRDWFSLLTGQGLQHILVLPLFAAVLIAAVFRSADASPAVQRVIRWFLLAGTAATIIHVMEFLVESQGAFPALMGEPVEVLELTLVYAMLLSFAVGIRAARTARA